MKKRSICLNMIVKNEAHVIERCLASVQPFIDYWVIVDTGSTDGTQDIIRNFFAEIPGELHQHEWVDFAHNRTQALKLAQNKADFALIIDADEILVIDDDFEFPDLRADGYYIRVNLNGIEFTRLNLLNTRLHWFFEGVIHEYPKSNNPLYLDNLSGITILSRKDGARSQDANTYVADMNLLERLVAENPDNSRYLFYLANTYFLVGHYDQSLVAFENYLQVSTSKYEHWYALYIIAKLKTLLEYPWQDVENAFLEAISYNSLRAEPAFWIAIHYQLTQEYDTAYQYFQQALSITKPDIAEIAVEVEVYDHLRYIEAAVAAYYIGHYAESIQLNNRVLQSMTLHPLLRQQIIENRRYSLNKVWPTNTATSTSYKKAIHVIICHQPVDTTLHKIIYSLLGQTHSNCFFHVVNLDKSLDIARYLAEDKRFVIHQNARVVDIFKKLLALENDCIVVFLPENAGMVNADTLQQITQAFNDEQCQFVYGMYRTDDSIIGLSMPPTNQQDWQVNATTLLDKSLYAVRNTVLPDGQLQDDRDITSLVLASTEYSEVRYLDTDLGHIYQVPGPLTNTGAAYISQGYKPKISCLMITQNRLSYALNAIRSYANQTYSNRELIVVSTGTPFYNSLLKQFIETHNIPSAQIIEISQRQSTLGYLRNVSLHAAIGELICQWDDDDMYHPQRLVLQYDHLKDNKAHSSFFTEIWQYLRDTNTLCWLDWSMGGLNSGINSYFPGTMLTQKDNRFEYPETGQYAQKGEDSAFLAQLSSRVDIVGFTNHAHLYVYQYHGDNTFSREHHYRVRTSSVETDFLLKHEKFIRDTVTTYPLARPIIVMGKKSVAFHIS